MTEDKARELMRKTREYCGWPDARPQQYYRGPWCQSAGELRSYLYFLQGKDGNSWEAREKSQELCVHCRYRLYRSLGNICNVDMKFKFFNDIKASGKAE